MTPIRKPTDPASLTTENGAKKAALLLPTLFPKPKTVPTAHSRLHSHTPDSPRTSPSSASSSCRGQRDQSEKIKSFLRSAKTRQDPFESNGFQDLKFIKWLQVTPVTHNRINRDSIRVQSHLGLSLPTIPSESSKAAARRKRRIQIAFVCAMLFDTREEFGRGATKRSSP